MVTPAEVELAPHQQAIVEVWERQLQSEFVDHSADAALETMGAMPQLNHVSVRTGGVGRDAIRRFYTTRFIPQMPPNTTIEPISRTIGHDRIVDEMIFKCTHTIAMDWYLPGVTPTGRRIEVPTVAIVRFRDGAIESEHIYWDQASVLVQIGLLEPASLPVAGIETAEKLRDPTRPSNALIARAEGHGKTSA